MNSFGTAFKFTTWGESHGPAIGVVIDGCPAGLPLKIEKIQSALDRRAPGKTPWTSPRKEPDTAELLSGVFEGVTTGAPISVLIRNLDADSSKYESTKDLLRPGHAQMTYEAKYGVYDWRGGGRSSARETATRVVAGAVAAEILKHHEIKTCAYLASVGSVAVGSVDLDGLIEKRDQSPLFCPCEETTRDMCALVEEVLADGDSIGGVVGMIAWGLPAGLGEPLFDKLEALLAHAMMSLPASKGFQIGSGFSAAAMRGSEHNDRFIEGGGTDTNNAGGVLGGISNGMPIEACVAFKPTSSIRISQETVDREGKSAVYRLAEGSRHDPCVAIRAVPVVEAMLNCVLADCVLRQQRTANAVRKDEVECVVV